jgi:hypothetical protein
MPRLQTGTLLFSRGDCLAVRVYTASPYTHVAAVVVTVNGPMVYESANGAGVRKLPLKDYLTVQVPDCVQVVQPRRPLTPEQGRAFEAALESRLGTPYAVHHHLTGQRCEGLHCSEYVTDALMSIELIRAERPPKVSPASLLTGITTGKVYESGELFELVPPPAPRPTGTNRCHRLWLETSRCLATCCDQLRGWFLCR